MEKLLITRKEAADALSVSLDTFDRLRTVFEIKCVRIGSRVYFMPEEIRSFVAGLL